MNGSPSRRETVCLITTGQPSTNPRLVKEADALVEAGYRVHVIGAWCSDWAARFDPDLLAARSWSFDWVDWRRTSAPVRSWWMRIRHRAANALLPLVWARSCTWHAALSRVTPELVAAAVRVRADLYIAHNLGALPAARVAGRRWNGCVGFDAEDFHSGELLPDEHAARLSFVENVERRLLPACTYVTAASPLIAEAYQRLTGVAEPTCILNVFPVRERPAAFRPSDDAGPIRLYWFSQTIGGGRGLEDALRAIGQLHEWPLELHLRGAWQAGYRDALLDLADRSGVPRERIVAHHAAPPDDMIRLAGDHDIGLALEQPVPVNRDIALTNKIFVYLLAGAAVVATRTRAQAALENELGEAALFYNPGDVTALVEGLRRWLEDRHALTRARRAAWRLGEARYNWDLEKGKFLSLVHDVLERRRRLPAQANSPGPDVPTARARQVLSPEP